VHVERMGPEVKRLLARPRCRRNSNIQVDANEGLGGLKMGTVSRLYRRVSD
jgi:hypothetical protein